MPVARTRALPVLLTGTLLAVLAAATSAAPPTTVRVSVSSTGTQANSDSANPSISTDGRYAVFSTSASTLVPGDVNGLEDVFMRNIATGATSMISAGGDKPSYQAAISGDGRYVAFASASAFVPADTNQRVDVYVRDTWSGLIELASVATDGTLGNNFSVRPSISGDGRYVAFESVASSLVPDDTNGRSDVFIRDLRTDTTARVSVGAGGTQATGDSDNPGISIDGQRVVFHSMASNLVAGDTNGAGDVFVRDIAGNATTRVSIATDGAQGNGDSGSYVIVPGGSPIRIAGPYVVFCSAATTLAPGDTNGAWDIFVRDTAANTTTRVSVATDGTQANGNSYSPSISQDGGYIAFASVASNLVAGDSNGQGDVFGRDTKAGTTARLSVAADGRDANQASDAPAIGPNARYVTFRSGASNLVEGDTNPFADIFVRGPLFSPTVSTRDATVSGLSATLRAIVNPTGAPATAWFDYGPTTAYGSSTTHIPTGAQNWPAVLRQTASGLSPATTYHYRAAIDDGFGAIYGDDAYFVTGAPIWGTALRFDGASEVHPPAFINIGGQFTVECWAKPADMATPNAMLGSRGPADASFDMKFMPNGIHGDIGNGSTWLTTRADAPMALTAGRWYHVAYVVTPSGYTIYVNGEQKATGSFSGIPILTDAKHQLVLGNYATGRNERFRGDLDEVRVWTTARTADEVRANYDQPLGSNTDGLAFYYRFDDGTGVYATDARSANLTATFSGNPLWAPSTAPLPKYTIPDALAALRVAAGLDAATLDVARRYATDPFAPGIVNLPAALAILRTAAGIGPNP